MGTEKRHKSKPIYQGPDNRDTLQYEAGNRSNRDACTECLSPFTETNEELAHRRSSRVCVQLMH